MGFNDSTEPQKAPPYEAGPRPALPPSVMGQRVVFGGLIIIGAMLLVWCDLRLADLVGISHPLNRFVRNGSVIPLAIAAITAWAGAEFASMLQRAGAYPARGWVVLAGFLLPLVPWLAAADLIRPNATSTTALMAVVFACLCLLVGSSMAIVRRGVGERAVAHMASTWLAILYVGLMPAFATLIRCDPDVPSVRGSWLLFYSIAIIKSGDTGAYFVGKYLGRTKLLPSVSPAKTVEGAMGSVAASILVAVALEWWLPTLSEGLVTAMLQFVGSQMNEQTTIVSHLTIGQTVILGLILSITGQAGDLFESYFKRAAQIKDSGRLIPVLGGILDMIDSPLFAIPFAWVLLSWIWAVI